MASGTSLRWMVHGVLSVALTLACSDRRCPRRPEASRDGHERDFCDASPAGLDRYGADDIRRRIGDCQLAEAGLVPDGLEQQVEELVG
jgi:hypothetical protein